MHFFAHRSNLHADCTDRAYCAPEADLRDCKACGKEEVPVEELDSFGRCFFCRVYKRFPED